LRSAARRARVATELEGLIARRELSRKGFLAGSLPLLASVPFARHLVGGDEALAQGVPGGDHAGRMEGTMSGSHGGTIGDKVIAASEDDLGLLLPPRARPHDPGRVRELELVARDERIELVRGTEFDGAAYNGTVPGPIVRVSHDDELRVMFTNESSHPHTIHFHGTHPSDMDGSLEPVPPGASYLYELKARPWGMHLYHCHTKPLASHIARGLYGAFIIDPPEPRRKAQELVLMMSGFDTDGDGVNDFYAFNGRPFQYDSRPIQVQRRHPVRIYLANVTEHDPVVSFHLHGEMFKLFRTGTGDTFELTDTVTLAQGERGILEIDFENKGLFMFHAHQSKLADKGLAGWFQVVDGVPPVLPVGGPGALYEDEFADCTPCLGELGAKALLKY
jgi:manganese oxidase